MKDKRFKVGDKVTYKNKKDCTRSDVNGTKGGYYLGGVDCGGFVGEIISYGGYYESMGCWMIVVTNNEGYSKKYNMLESEFLEYGKQPSNELFPIY